MFGLTGSKLMSGEFSIRETIMIEASKYRSIVLCQPSWETFLFHYQKCTFVQTLTRNESKTEMTHYLIILVVSLIA